MVVNVQNVTKKFQFHNLRLKKQNPVIAPQFFFYWFRASVRLVSIWLGGAGCLPKHLFGLVSPGFLDVAHTAGGSDAVVEGKGGRRGENVEKQSHQCDWLSGQRPKRGQRKGRKTELKAVGEWVGRGGFKSFKCPPEGSRGCQIWEEARHWLPACVRVSFCIPVRADWCSSVHLSRVHSYTAHVHNYPQG